MSILKTTICFIMIFFVLPLCASESEDFLIKLSNSCSMYDQYTVKGFADDQNLTLVQPKTKGTMVREIFHRGGTVTRELYIPGVGQIREEIPSHTTQNIDDISKLQLEIDDTTATTTAAESPAGGAAITTAHNNKKITQQVQNSDDNHEDQANKTCCFVDPFSLVASLVTKTTQIFNDFLSITNTPQERLCSIAKNNHFQINNNDDCERHYQIIVNTLEILHKENSLADIINAQSEEELGHTPLHIALIYQNWPFVIALIEFGADPLSTNSKNKSAYDFALQLDMKQNGNKLDLDDLIEEKDNIEKKFTHYVKEGLRRRLLRK